MTNILIGALLFFICSTGIFGYVSYELSEQKGMAVQALQEAQGRLLDSEKSLNLRDKSCQIDMDSTVQLEVEKAELKDKTEEISKQISNLPSGLMTPTVIKKPTNNIITEAPKNAEESHVLNGSELLSDDLRKLLLQAYCNVEPSSDQCSLPSRQSVN
jgi:hypothetical protein